LRWNSATVPTKAKGFSMADPIERLRTAARTVADATTEPDQAHLTQRRRRHRRARIVGRVAIAMGLVVVIVAAAALARSLRNNGQEPEPVQPGPTVVPAFTPASADFWDADRGIAGGSCSSHECAATTKGVIELTTDGGQTWRPVLQTDRPVLTVAVEGSDRAWAMTQGNDHLWTSDDAGLTWSLQSADGVPTDEGISALSFATDHEGWAIGVGADWSLLATTDGGRTWTQLPDPCHQAVPGGADDLIGITGISLPSRATGWVLCHGEPAAGSSTQAVFRSFDGGVTWTRMWSDFTVGLQGLEMLPSGVGWRWDWLSVAVAATDDGGRTWSYPGTQSRQLMNRYGNTPFASVSFVTPTTGYGLLGLYPGPRVRGVLLVTTDGGATWSAATTFAGPEPSPSP
jgi:photosystem II stability/assembly factor-like uncharacterized protein